MLASGSTPELALQDVDAHLVLAQRHAATPLPRIEAHQRPLHRFLQRVEAEQARGDGDGRRDRAVLNVVREQFRQRLDGQLAQPLALGHQPFLEGRLLHAEPLEQLAAVERPRFGERVGGPHRDQALERGDVDLHRRRHQRNRVGADVEDVAVVRRQGLADREQRLPQAVPRLRVRGLSPEERRQLVALVGLPGLDGQIGQQCLGFAARQDHRGSAVPASLKATEQVEPEGRHRSREVRRPTTLRRALPSDSGGASTGA